MSHNSTLQQAAPRLQHVTQCVPTYKQKVAAYIRIDTDASASPNERGPSCNYGLVLDTTLREDNEPSPCTPPDSTHGATADDRITHFENPRLYKRTMGMSLFHLLMSRCHALQCIVNASECKPHTQHSSLDIHKTYSRIFSFAQEAMKIAERLESVALEARCEYWAGRGCGGLRDWQAAIMHFTNAIRLNESRGSSENTISQSKGLLSHEKEDVEFLLQNAKQRHSEWLLRTKKIQQSQATEATEVTKDAGWKDMKGPPWTPNHDFRNWCIKQQLEKSKKDGARTNVFLPRDGQKVHKLWKHEIPMIRNRLNIPDGNDIFRRTLNADEWFYIFRGIPTATGDNISTNGQGDTEKKVSGVGKKVTTPVTGYPPSCSLEQSPLEESFSLDDELQQSGYMDCEEERPPSAGSFEGMTYPDVEGDLRSSPATASPLDPINLQATLLHIDSSGKGEDRSSSVTSSIS